ncbi:DUF3048 domain-containing protein [Saccharopolyspora erythraea]|uniref:DUF3048 domain-containing protein n=1 Tax=Saccharopolyspora erythraea TaxID=1836 RepID=UPI0020111DAB|nr:DUF3048 domain-containing protein [Saccharopolyspora erythraea]
MRRPWLSRVLGVLTATTLLLVGGVVAQRTTTLPHVAPAAPPPAPAPQPAPPPPLGPPVLAVKVDNAPAARPPTGLGAADVVFVEPVEAGITRLIAVFASARPPVVGPVRSARETDLHLLPQFGRPTLAFSGAAPELQPAIDQASVHNASAIATPNAYFRSGDRKAPHNMYVRPDRLPPGDGWSPRAPLVFGPPPPGGVPSTGQEVRYRAASMSFQWSDGRWLVSMDGRPHASVDSGRTAASTVVLQHVPVRDSALEDSVGNVSPFAETVGTGRATVLRDGMAWEATWSRPAPDLGTTYTTPTGEPIPFAPGQVWIVLVPA